VTTPLLKPSQYERIVGRYEKRIVRERVKTAETRKAQKAWSELSAKVCARAKGICQVSGAQTTRYGKGDPRLWGQAHHIVFRSAGGKDEMSNLIWVTFEIHTCIHHHQLDVTGTADSFLVTDPRSAAIGDGPDGVK
jgi:5-methylcytosine-specific restriction endonuclease McrA